MKKVIRLTESELHRIIKESVSNIINESSYDSMGNFDAEGHSNDLKERFSNVLNDFLNKQRETITALGNIATQSLEADAEVSKRARTVIDSIINSGREISKVVQLTQSNRWDENI